MNLGISSLVSGAQETVLKLTLSLSSLPPASISLFAQRGLGGERKDFWAPESPPAGADHSPLALLQCFLGFKPGACFFFAYSDISCPAVSPLRLRGLAWFPRIPGLIEGQGPLRRILSQTRLLPSLPQQHFSVSLFLCICVLLFFFF